jgi:hypothetical protein
METSIPSHRQHLLLVLLACLGLALPLMVTQSASAASPAPVRIRIDAISSDIAAPDGTPTGSAPSVLATLGTEITIEVSFWDGSDPANPASFNKDTTLSISSSSGTLETTTGIAPKNSPTAQLKTSFTTPANKVSLTVSVAAGRLARDVEPGTSGTFSPAPLFDVTSQLTVADAQASQGIGGKDNCTEATKQAPVCGLVLLPDGASSQVLMSLGLCTGAYTACGDDARGSVVQMLASLAGYSNTHPATVVIKCDKTLCTGGSIQNWRLSYTFSGTGDLGTAPPCPAKGVTPIDPDTGLALACVDYVQSKRDGSGDTYLYLLVPRDVRISVG